MIVRVKARKYEREQNSTQVSRPVLKRIESFLVGDSPSPEVFFGLQESVAKTLREQHFPAFVASQKCRRMIEEAAAAGITLG